MHRYRRSAESRDRHRGAQHAEQLLPYVESGSAVNSPLLSSLAASPGPAPGVGGERRTPPKVEFVALRDMEGDEGAKRDGENNLKPGGLKKQNDGGGSRLIQPRMSLLGKPINYKNNRRDVRYRRLQSKIYNFLERPRGCRAVTYHVIVFFMVFLCLVLSVFSTIDDYEVQASEMLFYMELVVVVWFGNEYMFRLWSAGCRSRYQGMWGRFKFLRRPFCIIAWKYDESFLLTLYNI